MSGTAEFIYPALQICRLGYIFYLPFLFLVCDIIYTSCLWRWAITIACIQWTTTSSIAPQRRCKENTISDWTPTLHVLLQKSTVFKSVHFSLSKCSNLHHILAFSSPTARAFQPLRTKMTLHFARKPAQFITVVDQPPGSNTWTCLQSLYGQLRGL